ncbi:hypothetical protein ACIGBH_27440 [Streptomyces sp. NPDC085929]|uniref:hypothetical protein n=1 Tax=Streptomyces sp. NPDC085929 TaxID=3365739 RepID=UPI0037D8578F
MNYADQIAIGTAVLTRRILGGTWQSVAVRGGAGALASPYALAELRPYPLAVPVGVAAWLGAAWWAGKAAPAPAAATPSPAGSPEPAAEQTFAPDLADAIRALSDGGHGTHLAVLAQHLAETTGRTWNTLDVRAACTTAGIPVTGSVRQRGRGVSTGVRLADLPDPSPAAPPTPVVAVVVAGQDPTTAPTTGPPTAAELHPTVREEAGMTIITDPSEARHYSVTKTP